MPLIHTFTGTALWGQCGQAGEKVNNVQESHREEMPAFSCLLLPPSLLLLLSTSSFHRHVCNRCELLLCHCPPFIGDPSPACHHETRMERRRRRRTGGRCFTPSACCYAWQILQDRCVDMKGSEKQEAGGITTPPSCRSAAQAMPLHAEKSRQQHWGCGMLPNKVCSCLEDQDMPSEEA